MLQQHCDDVGRDLGEIELSNELRNHDEAYADALYDQGVTLFTLGITGPYDDLRWSSAGSPGATARTPTVVE